MWQELIVGVIVLAAAVSLVWRYLLGHAQALTQL